MAKLMPVILGMVWSEHQLESLGLGANSLKGLYRICLIVGRVSRFISIFLNHQCQDFLILNDQYSLAVSMLNMPVRDHDPHRLTVIHWEIEAEYGSFA